MATKKEQEKLDEAVKTVKAQVKTALAHAFEKTFPSSLEIVYDETVNAFQAVVTLNNGIKVPVDITIDYRMLNKYN